MKTYSVKYILAALISVTVASSSAQTLRSTYFLEGATMRHQLNPAFMGERNYIAIPMLGNMNFGVQGNVGVSDFIYKYNDPTGKYTNTTFLNSSVSSKQFLNNLHDNNKLGVNINMTLLSTGFHAWGGFNTFDVGLRTNQSINLPYQLFNFMKTGLDKAEGSRYQIKDLQFRSNNYVEMALGHARPIGDKLTVGGKLKFLFGAANVNGTFDQMDIYMSQDKWEVTANGSLQASVAGADFKTKVSEKGQGREIDGIDVHTPGLGGFGLGLDLGATYKVLDNLTVSAAVLDLGFISWNNTLKGRTKNGTYTFDGFNDIAIDSEIENDLNDIDNQLDKMTDDLEDLARFYDDGKLSSRSTMLATTLNFAAEYKLPYYEKLSFGLLSSTHINKPFTWTEARISANVSPLRWFDASINYACSTFGSSLGWVLNFHPKGFNFFVGSDHMITNVTPQYLPVNNLNANVCLGFNVTFGSYKGSWRR